MRIGRFDLLGRVFSFNRGDIVFDGNAHIDPILDIALRREANDIVGGIAVTGRASAPTLSFISTPVLPRDEILPRILFGRSSTSLSATEALQLAAGVAALSSGQAGLADQLCGALGVDVLSIDAGGRDDAPAAVNVGRYIRDGIYVGAKQALNGNTGSFVIKAEVLDADVGQTGKPALG